MLLSSGARSAHALDAWAEPAECGPHSVRVTPSLADKLVNAGIQRMLDACAEMEAEAGEQVAPPPVSPHDFSAYPAHLLYSVRAAFLSNAERCASGAAQASFCAGCSRLLSFSSVPSTCNFLKVTPACACALEMQRLKRLSFGPATECTVVARRSVPANKQRRQRAAFV